MQLAQLCRCTEGALPWGEEFRCFHCGRDTWRSELATEVLAVLVQQRDGWAALGLAVEAKRDEMIKSGEMAEFLEGLGLPVPSGYGELLEPLPAG